MRVLMGEDDVTLSSALYDGLARARRVVEDADSIETISMPGFVARFRTGP